MVILTILNEKCFASFSGAGWPLFFLFLTLTAFRFNEIIRHALSCIPIHALKIHQSDSERFSWGKTCGFEARAGKSRTGRLSGARNETLW